MRWCPLCAQWGQQRKPVKMEGLNKVLDTPYKALRFQMKIICHTKTKKNFYLIEKRNTHKSIDAKINMTDYLELHNKDFKQPS